MAFRTQLRNSSADSSQEQIDAHNSSEEMHSPAPLPASTVLRRRLEFASPAAENENKNVRKLLNAVGSVSPPYRKVRALRLFDTPATPKTILQKSSSANQTTTTTTTAAPQQSLSDNCKPAGRESLPLHNRALSNVRQQTANVNPFTPDSLMAHNKKRCRTQFGHENNNVNQSFPSYITFNQQLDEEGELQPPKRLALRDTNISRYQKEFVEISLIGIGEFGLVYKCLNRLDGCIYAIKKSIKPVAGSCFEKRALNEVYAHAVLGKHDNVVRYYSAWAEDNHMLIQNEFCNGGSLQAFLQRRTMTEAELKILLLHVAEGLRYIHSNDLVHMDLKAGNIFLTKAITHTENCTFSSTPKAKNNNNTNNINNNNSAYHNNDNNNEHDHEHDDDHDMESILDELNDAECLITYKIGDLGHVTSVKDPNVEEGDCRYLPNEILQGDYSQLFKADIFALGLTLYEAAGGGQLPKNGPEWHKLRNGNIPYLPQLSKQFNDLIKQMTHPKPEKRPTISNILNHSLLSTMDSKSKSQLTQELVIEKQKNEILLKKLCEVKKQLKAYEQKEKARKIQNLPIQRSLRSYTRNKRLSCGLGAKIDTIRDQHKNVINY